jgi:hypothetical protein
MLSTMFNLKLPRTIFKKQKGARRKSSPLGET